MVQTRLRIRAVCDTNTVVSALLFSRGRLAWMRVSWREGQVVPLVCRESVVELLRVLAYPKFRLDSMEQPAVLGDFLPHTEVIAPVPPIETPRCRNDHDQIFLELAVAGRADVLVTGDQDLLTLAAHFPVPIETPAAFRRRLCERGAIQGAPDEVRRDE